MSKADKKQIDKLMLDNGRLVEEICDMKIAFLKSQNRETELREEIQKEKQKYAVLLERYVSMMERTVGIDDQRETD